MAGTNETPRAKGGKGPGRGRPPRGWKPKFLAMLSQTGNVLAACRAAGVGRMTAYRYRERDRLFAEGWEEAIEESVDLAELECRRRGVQGYDRPVFYQGAQIGVVREHSDRCLLAYLAAKRPEEWRSNYDLRPLVAEAARLAASQSPATGPPED